MFCVRNVSILLLLFLSLVLLACNDAGKDGADGQNTKAPQPGTDGEMTTRASKIDTVPLMGALRDSAYKDAVLMTREVMKANPGQIGAADEAVLYYVIAAAYDKLGGRDTTLLYSQRAVSAWQRAGTAAGELQLHAAHMALKSQLRSGNSDHAEPFFAHVMEYTGQVYGAKSAEYASEAAAYAKWLIDAQRFVTAIDQLKVAHSIYQSLDSSAAAARSLQLQGVALFGAGDLRSAGVIFDEVFEVRQGLYTGNHVELAESHNSRGIIAFADKRHEEAASHFERAANMHAALHGDNDKGLIDILQNLQTSYSRLGRIREAAAIGKRLKQFEPASEL